jgi:hypothetical protein
MADKLHNKCLKSLYDLVEQCKTYFAVTAAGRRNLVVLTNVLSRLHLLRQAESSQWKAARLAGPVACFDGALQCAGASHIDEANKLLRSMRLVADSMRTSQSAVISAYAELLQLLSSTGSVPGAWHVRTVDAPSTTSDMERVAAALRDAVCNDMLAKWPALQDILAAAADAEQPAEKWAPAAQAAATVWAEGAPLPMPSAARLFGIDLAAVYEQE